ncbi:MAG: FAD-dependent oxidoreductase, partial [Pirellulales bacterium]
GNASSEVRMHVVGADCSGRRGIELETEAREGGLIEEIRLENCVRNPQRSSSVFDLILYEKCRSEPNLTLLLNTTVIGAEVEDRRIVRAIAERQSTEDRFSMPAAVFIDATGDGRLGVEVGAPFMEGRESREQFGESLAQPVADAQRLGSSIMFQARNFGRPMPFQAPAWARKFTEADLQLRPHGTTTAGMGDLGLEYGYWWVEWGGHLDTIKCNEQVRDELLAIVLGVWDHVKNGGDHGAANWALEWFGFLPGKRESRRFVGQHVLTETDVLHSTAFDDAIAYGGWFIDTHPPLGVDAIAEPPCTQHQVPHLYDIPLRACLSRDFDNLMFAGRNMSATHIAFASTRVMATCSVVGQGVGTAAAYAAHHALSPASLPANAAAVEAIQQQLLEDDAFLIGRVNNDSRNLAQRAKVTASSEQRQGVARSAVVGPTRSVHGPGGAPRERTKAGTHRWMSDPAAGLPAWIQLDWPEPITPSRLQLVFDTGMHRVLTFSLAEAYTQTMLWGRPQPETVRDYKVESRHGGLWKLVQEVAGNYQRCNNIDLQGTAIEALRVTVNATNGLDHARICRIGVY